MFALFLLLFFIGPTSSTGSTLSEPKVKRRRLINYLSGEGQKYWGEGENLIVNDMNVTRILKKFRSRNIMEAEEKALLNDVRVLCCEHI
ncbi:uncharacterized protein B0P05DRAFT_529323 [Gilbertella persicaria]|uniref:uncharacterized protein n=1 Tax=Gilbertella persicaria TaxID=101096 RepID=UPI002220FAE4|nr:uncharacterized protein B0P05DRAFT_529323 [Gilbertella persicaria]KAI8090099.1 hypothetical protein B0P05DRAFT_529323 [Gilbertella persicaria]